MVRKPECCHLGWGENDEGLSQGTESLTQHHYYVRDVKTLGAWCAHEAQHGSKHVQPGAQDQLQGQDGGDRSKSIFFQLYIEEF